MAFNFTYPQGTDYVLSITVNDENNDPLDLTGYTFRGHLRRTYSGTLEFDFTMESLDQAIYPGQFKAKIANTDFTTIIDAPLKLVYDIEIVSSGGLVTRVLEGVCTVTPEATR